MQTAQGVLSGMSISYGSGIYLSWAAFACLAASIVPYMLRYVLIMDMGMSVLFTLSLYSSTIARIVDDGSNTGHLL